MTTNNIIQFPFSNKKDEESNRDKVAQAICNIFNDVSPSDLAVLERFLFITLQESGVGILGIGVEIDKRLVYNVAGTLLNLLYQQEFKSLVSLKAFLKDFSRWMLEKEKEANEQS